VNAIKLVKPKTLSSQWDKAEPNFNPRIPPQFSKQQPKYIYKKKRLKKKITGEAQPMDGIT